MKFTNQASLLRRARTIMGMNQDAFGKILGVSAAMVSKVERGEAPLSEARWALLVSVIPKNRAMDACMEDFLADWSRRYDATAVHQNGAVHSGTSEVSPSSD